MPKFFNIILDQHGSIQYNQSGGDTATATGVCYWDGSASHLKFVNRAQLIIGDGTNPSKLNIEDDSTTEFKDGSHLRLLNGSDIYFDKSSLIDSVEATGVLNWKGSGNALRFSDNAGIILAGSGVSASKLQVTESGEIEIGDGSNTGKLTIKPFSLVTFENNSNLSFSSGSQGIVNNGATWIFSSGSSLIVGCNPTITGNLVFQSGSAISGTTGGDLTHTGDLIISGNLTYSSTGRSIFQSGAIENVYGEIIIQENGIFTIAPGITAPALLRTDIKGSGAGGLRWMHVYASNVDGSYTQHRWYIENDTTTHGSGRLWKVANAYWNVPNSRWQKDDDSKPAFAWAAETAENILGSTKLYLIPRGTDTWFNFDSFGYIALGGYNLIDDNNIQPFLRLVQGVGITQIENSDTPLTNTLYGCNIVKAYGTISPSLNLIGEAFNILNVERENPTDDYVTITFRTQMKFDTYHIETSGFFRDDTIAQLWIPYAWALTNNKFAIVWHSSINAAQIDLDDGHTRHLLTKFVILGQQN